MEKVGGRFIRMTFFAWSFLLLRVIFPMVSERVLIAGAGPVGQICGYWLARKGIPVLLLDKSKDIPEDLRASTWHPATLDMLQEYEITNHILEKGSITPSWQYRFQDTGERAIFELEVLKGETGHPYRVQCEQFHVVRHLTEKIGAVDNAEIRWGAEVVDVHQDDQGVSVTVEQAGERYVVHGRYLIGCDGGHSRVRERLKLGFEGKTYPVLTMVAITDFPFENYYEGLSGVNYVWTKESNFSLLKVPDRWRSGITPKPGQSPDEALSDGALQQHFQNVVARPGENYNILAKGRYQTHQKVTERFNAGRVLLAGDAAHLNSPNGGLGMNCGVHDAINLVGKLLDVWHGADPSVFDLYTRQRKAIATEYVHRLSDANHHRMRERDPAKRREIMDNFKRITSDPRLMKDYLMESSMINAVRHAESIE